MEILAWDFNWNSSVLCHPPENARSAPPPLAEPALWAAVLPPHPEDHNTGTHTYVSAPARAVLVYQIIDNSGPRLKVRTARGSILVGFAASGVEVSTTHSNVFEGKAHTHTSDRRRRLASLTRQSKPTGHMEMERSYHLLPLTSPRIRRRGRVPRCSLHIGGGMALRHALAGLAQAAQATPKRHKKQAYLWE